MSTTSTSCDRPQRRQHVGDTQPQGRLAGGRKRRVVRRFGEGQAAEGRVRPPADPSCCFFCFFRVCPRGRSSAESGRRLRTGGRHWSLWQEEKSDGSVPAGRCCCQRHCSAHRALRGRPFPQRCAALSTELGPHPAFLASAVLIQMRVSSWQQITDVSWGVHSKPDDMKKAGPDCQRAPAVCPDLLEVLFFRRPST